MAAGNQRTNKQSIRSWRPFSAEEYAERLANVRKIMSDRGLDGLLLSMPENIFYLTGLDYQGYFAYQLMIVPLDGKPLLITRAVERAIIRDRVPEVGHVVYSDGVDPIPAAQAEEADLVMAAQGQPGTVEGLHPWSTSIGVPTREIAEAPNPYLGAANTTVESIEACGLASGRLGIEKGSTFLPYGVAEAIVASLPHAAIEEATDLVTDIRLVQSPAEQAYTRQAAAISDSMALAAVAAAGPNVYKRDVLAAVHQMVFQRGGSNPGFVPLIRATRTLEHEHGPWEAGRLGREDILFIEMSGCAQRYHAPISRLVFIGKMPPRSDKVRIVCEDAIKAAQDTMKPGVPASEVYTAWQSRLDANGLSSYRRHHCGYAVGIGFPPSWTGSGIPLGLRQGSTMRLRPGMVFHLMSWLLRTGRGDYVISDTVLVTEDGCEVLTKAHRGPFIR